MCSRSLLESAIQFVCRLNSFYFCKQVLLISVLNLNLFHPSEVASDTDHLYHFFNRLDSTGPGLGQWAGAYLFRQASTLRGVDCSPVQFQTGKSMGWKQDLRQRADQEWKHWQECSRTPVLVRGQDQVQWGKLDSLGLPDQPLFKSYLPDVTNFSWFAIWQPPRQAFTQAVRMA